MGIKDEIKAAAVATIQCPSCGAEPGSQCVMGTTKRDEVTGAHVHRVKESPHERRLSTYVANHIKFSGVVS